MPGLNDPDPIFWKADYKHYDESERVFIKEHCQFFNARYMYKDFARIWLEIKEIKIERVQEISEKSSIAEGIGAIYEKALFGEREFYRPDRALSQTARSCYEHLWDKINGNKFPFESNPWVWVIRFKVISKTGRPEQLGDRKR